MYPNTIPADVLVFINGLPRLPAAGPAGVPPHLPDAMRRFVLRRLGEQDPNDMSKIYMPMDGVSGANNDEFAVVRCHNDSEAQQLINDLNGAVIDVNHTFVVERAASSQRFDELEQNGLVDREEVERVRVLRRP